jgi:hypothetical protein
MTSNGWASSGTDETARNRRFLLLLDDPKDVGKALAELAEWVHKVLVPVYMVDDMSMRWCTQWYRHPDVTARLHALYLAWCELVEPSRGGASVEVSRWHRDHLDPAMREIRARGGSLSQCGSVVRGKEHKESLDYPIVPMEQLPPWLVSGSRA